MSIALTLKSFVLGQPNNEELMLDYAKYGDTAVLTQLYETCGNDLYHFVLTLSEPTIAKDICQKTWLKVIEKKHLYENSGQFKAWLFTLARNQLFDEYRRQKNVSAQIDKLVSHENELNNISEQSGLEAMFDRALLNLNFEQREAFCLQQEGFSLQDIANITHVCTETVKSRLRYARDNIRSQLNEFRK
ncbi:sigma-70 family RNA polymerase sigma factor [Paraglaciecola sp.]|uniref:sigma-70 family RNA polymerase sigma factor n=1 Tax=Paraglaciecola sp. TaxID=1920173 RepID=UPI003EFA9697